MLEIKSTVAEIKYDFDGLINRLDTAKEIINELETSKNEMQKQKKNN